MPRLISVDLVYGTSIDVTFTTSREVCDACDTAVLQLAHANGSELGIRIERGRIADVYLWDAAQFIRQNLPPNHVAIDGLRISCTIPLALLPAGALAPRVEATLSINGTPVQTRFPVAIRALHHADLHLA
ncbi:hypothetical protein BH10ACT7_BH10ACT7_00250 [soil metagenome]